MTDQEVLDAEQTEELRQLPAVRQSEAMIARGEVTVEEVVAGHDKIVAVMEAVMKEGIHFGKIPGVNKPTLLKPGAEVLLVTLRLSPDFDSQPVFSEDQHLVAISKCTLRHIPTQLVIATGEGLCSTRESKYAWRQGMRTCPKCGAAAIVRSTRKSAYFCISNEGGCGERFGFGTKAGDDLDRQDTSRVPNPDLPDTWNTVLKMANKRALVAAVLAGTAASDVFTQDVEDMAGDSTTPQSRGTGSAPSAESAPANPPGDAAGGAQGFPLPRNWKQIEEVMRAYDDAIWDAFQEFGRQAGEKLREQDPALPTAKFNTAMRQAAAIAAKYVRDQVDPGSFPPPGRDVLHDGWYEALQLDLEGPEWRLSPDEADRPERPTEQETT
jgi:hypothetical protein